MWKIHRKTISVALCLGFSATSALAQNSPGNLDQNGPIFVPQSSSSSSYNQQGFNLPSAPRPSGQDTIRGAGGISCQSALGGNGPTLDMGVIGTNDIYSRNSTALYGRVTLQLGKKPQRVDCNRLYNLEVERLKMELALMRAGSIGADAGYDDPYAVRNLMTQANGSASGAPVQPADLDEDDLPESASISPFTIGGPKKAKPTKVVAAPDADDQIEPLSEESKGFQLGPMSTAPKADPASKTAAPKTAAPAPVRAVVAPKPAAARPVQSQSFAKAAADILPKEAIALANIGDEVLTQNDAPYFAQLGAFSTLENAQAAWKRFSADVPDDLPGAYAIANPVKRSGKTLYLLQAGPYSKGVTNRVCSAINSGCYAVRTTI